MNKFILASAVVFSAFASIAFAAPSQTAQDVMVSVTPDSPGYEIVGTITWKFDRGEAEPSNGGPGCAMKAYTNTVVAGPFVTCSGGGKDNVNCALANAPTDAAMPVPNDNKRKQHAQEERCTFFNGGDLTALSYTSPEVSFPGANGKGIWKYTWDYEVAPVVTPVDEHTCWSSLTEGTLPSAGFDGFVSSESYMNGGGKKKYSFTLIDGEGSRVRNVSAQLQIEGPAGTWTDVGLPIVYASPLPVTSTVVDYVYYGNGEHFGNANVYNALHADGGKGPNSITNILTGVDDGAPSDDFAGNNNDLAAGNVHEADFTGLFSDLSVEGNYRVAITGTLKGNTTIGTAAGTFTVSSSLTVIGGCTE